MQRRTNFELHGGETSRTRTDGITAKLARGDREFSTGRPLFPRCGIAADRHLTLCKLLVPDVLRQSDAIPMQRLSPSRWTVSDAIDFDQLLAEDDAVVAAQATAFAAARASLPASAADRSTVFRDWTRFVRDRSTGPSAGDVYRRGRWLAATLLGGVGFVAGATLAGSLLARRDAEPVNALLFLGWTVGLQVAFLIAVALLAGLRAAQVRFGPAGETALALVKLLGRAVNRLDGKRRTALQARWATLDLRSERLAPLIGTDLLIVTQRFAIAFNVGLLAAMLLVHLPFEELRFGWQSTYSFTVDGVEAAVRTIASPWSWLTSALVPSASQIAETRFVRGQRAETLPAEAAHAWWPFLLAAIVVYGLAARLLLAAVGHALLRRRLERLDFAQPAANALWRRLTGPLMQATGGTDRLPIGSTANDARARGEVDLLIVEREARTAELRVRIERHFAGPVARITTATVDDDALADDLVAALTTASSVVVAIDASRDPIVAIAGFLDALVVRSRDADVTVALVAGDGSPAGVTDERFAIWQRFVAIQRLRVGIERAA